MVPLWFDNSFSGVLQWLPVLMASLALFSTQLFGRSA